MKIEIVNTIESRTDDQGAKHLSAILSYESVYWRRGQFGMRRHTYNNFPASGPAVFGSKAADAPMSRYRQKWALR